MKGVFLDKFIIARREIAPYIHFALLDSRPDDQFIASFPRSGSTWLRTMLSNVIMPDAKSNPDVFNSLIPGVTIKKMSQFYKMQTPRIMMTHSFWQPKIKRAVYVVRDGRDSLVSYYHYNTTRANNNETFEVFFDKYIAGYYGNLWNENVESWILNGQKTLNQNLLIVKFEDLKQNTESVLKEIVGYLKLDSSDDLLKNAIKLSSIDSMKKIEKQRRKKDVAPDESFYRGGKTGGWNELFTDEIEEIFMKKSSYALHKLGYI